MRIYLSAYRLGARADVLASSGGRAAAIMNALDPSPDRLLSWDREASDLARLGYSSTELDLRELWANPDALPRRLSDVDLLWLAGPKPGRAIWHDPGLTKTVRLTLQPPD